MHDDSNRYAYGFLTPPEVQFLDAAVERLIPTDELGPGARDAGVSYYIDRQLMGNWGVHGRNYRMGPWAEGTPQQGFQSRLTPQEIYRYGIADTEAHCKREYGKAFRLLTAEQQDEVLRGLEKNTIELPSLSAKLFFGLLWRNTEEGFFADPVYGGNRNKAGWRLLGFPGVAASNYNELMYTQTTPYRVEPVSILDIREQRVALDNQGYPKHVPLKNAKDGHGSH
jgi:gluconate 2-dehydrogenase gamma chain